MGGSPWSCWIDSVGLYLWSQDDNREWMSACPARAKQYGKFGEVHRRRSRISMENGLSLVEGGTYDQQDRLVTYAGFSYTFNLAGELESKVMDATGSTTRYQYDSLGGLQEVTLPDGKVVSYVIDGQGRRVGKKVNGAFKQGLIYKDQLNPVAELGADGSLKNLFVYGTNSHVPEYMISSSGTVYGLISDDLGNVRLVVNSGTGAVAQLLEYDEFGRVVVDTNPGFQPFGFAGGVYDHETGLVRFGARDYDSISGRWTAKDPIGFNGGDTNLYGYVLADPVNYVDPLGLWGLQLGYNLGGLLGVGGAGISGGIAVVGNGWDLSSINVNGYQGSQFGAGLGLSFGRGIHASVTPGAQCLDDLGGVGVGGGVDTPVGGASLTRGSAGNTYSLTGPSLGYSTWIGATTTNIGSPVKITPQALVEVH